MTLRTLRRRRIAEPLSDIAQAQSPGWGCMYMQLRIAKGPSVGVIADRDAARGKWRRGKGPCVGGYIDV